MVMMWPSKKINSVGKLPKVTLIVGRSGLVDPSYHLFQIRSENSELAYELNFSIKSSQLNANRSKI